jgi:hypothetical protein
MEGGDRLRSRLASLRCADCGRPYADSHVRVRAEREAISFVDLVCRRCGGQASAIATVVLDREAGLRIELGELDQAAADAIEIGDVVEMSSFLSTFDGDFRRHFARPGRGDGPFSA